MCLESVHDFYLLEGSVNGERFEEVIRSCLSPILQPFNGINARSVVIVENTSIHHVDSITDLIETQAGARLLLFP